MVYFLLFSACQINKNSKILLNWFFIFYTLKINLIFVPELKK
jgi:hypothetical protein